MFGRDPVGFARTMTVFPIAPIRRCVLARSSGAGPSRFTGRRNRNAELLGRRWFDASGSNGGAYPRANVATNHGANHGSDDGSNYRPNDDSDHRSDDEADNGSDDRSERSAHDGSDDCADDGTDHRSYDGTDDGPDDRANDGTDDRADNRSDHAPHGDADARSDGNSDPDCDSGIGARRLADVRIRRSAGRLQSVHGCVHTDLTFGASYGLE